MSADKIRSSVVEGNVSGAQTGVRNALEQGTSAEDILKKSLIPAMDEVGVLFENGDLYVPEMLVAARAMQAGLAILRPQLVMEGVEPAGKVVIGTVKGDLHDIGKNLLGMMLEGAGFEVIDLGTDVSPEKFASVVQESGAKILGMSALLTTTMPGMKSTIEALEDMNLRQTVKVMVGGAPVTEAFARMIGADGYAPDASRAVSVAKVFAQVPVDERP